MLKYKPQYSLNNVLNEIWPYDPWSRKEIMAKVSELNLPYTEIPTTMGTYALKFSKEDFDILLKSLQKM